MTYIENIKKLLNGETNSGNALEYELHELIEEVKNKGIAYRDYVLMNNAYFRQFSEFSQDWQKELKNFCNSFNIDYKISEAGSQLTFFKKV